MPKVARTFTASDGRRFYPGDQVDSDLDEVTDRPWLFKQPTRKPAKKA